MDLQLDVNEAFLAALISHLRNLNFEIPEATYRKSFTAVHSYRLCSFLTPLSFDTYPFMSCLFFFYSGSIVVLGPGVPCTISPTTVIATHDDKLELLWHPPGTSDTETFTYDPATDPDAELDNYPATEPLDEFTSGLPYPCRKCGAINRPRVQKLWYAVLAGHRTGVVYGQYVFSLSSIVSSDTWLLVMPCTRSPSSPTAAVSPESTFVNLPMKNQPSRSSMERGRLDELKCFHKLVPFHRCTL
jgi:hypothetical protein